MLYLKADTITEITVGPALAVGDGFTPVTNLVGSSADEFELIKHSATSTTTVAGTLAAITGADGYYALDLSETDTNTEGRLVFLINDDSLIKPIRHEFMVVSANVFDSFYAVAGTDLLNVEINAASVDLIWDEVLTGATHNVATSAGRRLREIAGHIIRSETAQGSGTGSNQIQLDTGASSVDGSYDPALVLIASGTGIGQSRNILQYDGASRTATVDRNWKVNPDATSAFILIADAGREHVNEGLAQAGAANSITLNTLAASQDGVYIGSTVFLRSGTGDDQSRVITGYNGTTKVATIRHAWDVNPDSTTGYVMIPTGLNYTTGYNVGRITIDTVNGTAGTDAFVNGVADNSVLTLADARTLGTEVGLSDYHVINGSALTLVSNSDNLSFFGDNWTLDLGGQSCATAHFEGATVSGIQTGTGCGFVRGSLGTVTLADDIHVNNVELTATITLPAGDMVFDDCHMGGTSGPTFDFGAAVGNTTLHVHHFAGHVTIDNLGALGTDILNLDGKGRLVINASCVGGSIRLRGNWDVDNAGSGITITQDDLSTNVINIKSDTDDIQTRLPAALISGRMDSDVEAINDSTVAAIQLALSAAEIENGVVEGTPSTTIIQTDLAETQDDIYIGRIVIFTSGAARGEATSITDYTGSTGTLVVVALANAPAATDIFILL